MNKHFESGNADSLFVNQGSQTGYPLKIALREKASRAAIVRFDEPLFLVKPQSPGMNTQKLSSNANRIDR